MLGSWFKHDRKASHNSQRKSLDHHTSPQNDAAEHRVLPPLDRAVTAALSTPHDALLAELQAHRPDVQVAAKIDTVPEAPEPPVISIAGSPEHSDEGIISSAQQGLRSTATTPPPEQDPLIDPFSGTVIGHVSPLTSDKAPDQEPVDIELDQTTDELWTHLARIRELQSQISGLHIQMEAIGTSENRRRRPRGAVGPVHSDTIGPADDWEPGEEEEAKRKARDEEFVSLTEKFKGRRAVIDDIMNKLDELSKALTAFHALPTPTMTFSNPRSSTKQSTFSPALSGSPMSDFSEAAIPPLALSPASLNIATIMKRESQEIAGVESPTSLSG